MGINKVFSHISGWVGAFLLVIAWFAMAAHYVYGVTIDYDAAMWTSNIGWILMIVVLF
jgi:hypothetical protein